MLRRIARRRPGCRNHQRCAADVARAEHSLERAGDGGAQGVSNSAVVILLPCDENPTVSALQM